MIETQAEAVARLRKVESLVGLVQESLSDGKALEGGVGIEPRRLHVANDLILQVTKVLILRVRARRRFVLQGAVQMPVKYRDVYVESGRGIARRKGSFVVRSKSRRSEGGNCWQLEVALGGRITLRRTYSKPLADEFRTILQGLLNKD